MPEPKNGKIHCFENQLLVPLDELELNFGYEKDLPWSEFILNPRKLRGSDFLMRWSQGEWSEERLLQAINQTKDYFGIPYGPSGVAPSGNVRDFELYFERLENAGLGDIKRPDLLLFSAKDKEFVLKIVGGLGGLQELPFTSESDARMKELLKKAIMAIECENSLWKAQAMPDYKTSMTPQKRMGGKLGMKKTAVLPTIILKEEDRGPLVRWQNANRVKIHIWHVFYDQAYGIELGKAEQLIKNGGILPTEQVFQAPGGATTKKIIYKIYYHHGYPLGQSDEEPKLSAQCIIDKNGHILPYVKFEGGHLSLTSEALGTIGKIRR